MLGGPGADSAIIGAVTADTGRLSVGDWGWAAPGRRHRIMTAGIKSASAPRTTGNIVRAGKRQLEQWEQYREAADGDFQDVLSALHRLSRPWDQTYAHQMAFRLTGALRFGAESHTPGRAEAPVDISLGTMLALDDFFVRLACHGGFFSSGPDGPWWSGCQCFWAGRGNDCLPFTRYYDYQLRISAGKIWRTWLSGYFFRYPAG